MAKWKEIYEQAGEAANKAVKKTGEIATTATKYVKLKMLDAKISSHFEVLGRLTYKQIKSETSMAERIAEVIEKIDSLKAQRKALHDQIEAEKKLREEKKKAKAQTESNAKEETPIE